MKNIILAGSGGHAKVIAEIIEENGDYRIIGVVTNDNIKTFLNYPILGTDEDLPRLFKEGNNYIALGIGAFRNNDLRSNLFNYYTSIGFKIPTLIHKSAILSPKCKIGQGIVVCAGSILMTGAQVGDNVIIYTGSTVDHETIIEENVLVSAGVTIGAYSNIKKNSLIGLGAKIISGVTVGENCLVAAGAVVVNDIKPGLTVYGIPAK